LLLLVAAALSLVACAGSSEGGDHAGSSADAVTNAAGEPIGPKDAPIAAPTGCTSIGTDEVALATASDDGEQILTLDAQALSKTSWEDKGNEAVVLEVRSNGARLANIILHQGADKFTYSMTTGALKKGDALTVKVSDLSAPRANKTACFENAKIALPAANMAEGVQHAPIVKWPNAKAFNDTPILLGWSRKGKAYQLTYTNEDGGTTALCGGGAEGMRSEIARWGRGLDMEGVFGYGGAGHFERCTGTIPLAADMPRMHDDHPVLYLGSSHNTVFESRGGYGQACGTSSDKEADGKLEGWNDANPGNDESKDDPFVVVIRPVPVDQDAAASREAMVNMYAPWLYRLVDSELKREGKVDEKQTFSMNRYLFIDVYADDVGGSGDETCGPVSLTPSITHVTGGFRLNAISKDGTVSKGPQMTADYFGSTVKRIAVPLAAGVQPEDIVKVQFDAYDDDGIYFIGIGDAFVPEPTSDNNATLHYLHQGPMKPANVYVDDDNSSCTNGVNVHNGTNYPCEGSAFTLDL
jgi:hypothetical protein